MSRHKIPARVTQGYGIASGRATNSPYPAGSIAMQIPHFKKRGLDLSGFKPATLNLDIRPYCFQWRQPEYVFRQVAWTDIVAPEDFYLSSCALFYQGKTYRGYVYYPCPETKPGHLHPDHLLEVIAEPIAKIGHADQVALAVDSAAIAFIQPANAGSDK